jgi:hypothetical protein
MQTDRATLRRSISPAEPLWCLIGGRTIQTGKGVLGRPKETFVRLRSSASPGDRALIPRGLWACFFHLNRSALAPARKSLGLGRAEPLRKFCGVSLGAGMCARAAPLAYLAHKWVPTSVRTASTRRSCLLAFGAQRDSILQRDRILLRVLRPRRVTLVQMFRPFRLRESNGHGNYEQRHSESLQHSFFVLVAGWVRACKWAPLDQPRRA